MTLRDEAIRLMAGALTAEYPDGDAREHEWVATVTLDGLLNWLAGRRFTEAEYASHFGGAEYPTDLSVADLIDLLRAKENT